MAQDIGEKAYLSHTAQEIDDAIDALPTEVTAREKLQAAVVGLIDSGAKNRMTINSGSNTLPTRWINIPVSFESGNYRVYFGNLTSDDTDAEKCQACFLDSANTQVSNWLSFERGTDVSAAATLTGSATTFRLYPSDSYAHSEGDTVTFTDGMVCAESDWSISKKYVPYCPTMEELYQMILDLGGGNRSMNATPTEEQEEQR